MSEAITPWLHVVGVTVWVGPQFFLFIAAVPAVRTIDDMAARARVMRIITTRFGWMAWGALLLILLTGISQIFSEAADFDELLNFDYRWVNTFALKMLLVAVMVILTAVHSFIIGPRQLDLMERGETGEDVVRLRRSSIILSATILILSIVVIFLGLLLAEHEWSFQEA